jgi:hypothetical protein
MLELCDYRRRLKEKQLMPTARCVTRDVNVSDAFDVFSVGVELFAELRRKLMKRTKVAAELVGKELRNVRKKGISVIGKCVRDRGTSMRRADGNEPGHTFRDRGIGRKR